MMPTNKITIAGLRNRVVLFMLFLFAAPSLFAQQQNAAQDQPSKGAPITAGEVVMYVAIILALMVFAWWLATREKKVEDKHHATIARQHNGHPQHHHNNDPYFRRAQQHPKR